MRFLPLSIFVVTFLIGCSLGLTKSKLSIEGLLSGHYTAKGVQGFWATDSKFLYRNGKGDAVFLDVFTLEKTVVIEAGQLYNYTGYNFQSASADGKFLLITWSSERLYFVSTLSYHTLKFVPVSPDGIEQPKLMGFNGANKESAFAFVYENNVYYVPNAAELQIQPPIQLTHDGIRDGPIFNAQPDYENDQVTIFDGGPIIFRFSLESDYLIFLKYDDTDVDIRQVPLYGDSSDATEDNTYPKWRKLYWAMVGRPITKYSVMLANLILPHKDIQNSVTAISFPVKNVDVHERISLPLWLDFTTLQVKWSDRSNHHLVYYECQMQTQPLVCSEVSRVIFPMENYPKEYTRITPLAANEFIAMYPTKVTHLQYVQVIRVDRSNYQAYQPVTFQEFTVKKIIAFDKATGDVYFYATGFHEDGKPDFSHHHAYKINIFKKSQAGCLTCNFENSHGELCLSNEVRFNPGFSHIHHVCQGPGIPEIVIRLNDGIYGSIVNLEANTELRTRLSEYDLPEVQEYTVPIPNSEFVARVKLLIPPNFDPSGKTKYPLLVDSYPSPEYPSIHHRFGIELGDVISGSKDVIVALIDGKCTNDQSWDALALSYMTTGTIEFEDQLTTTRWLVENLDFINPNKTAIWGGSYGGYATLGVLAHDSEHVVKCGVAVASQLSMLYGGSLNEPYMGGPPNDFTMEAYNQSTIWYNGVENFKNKKLLMLHSDSDLQCPFAQVMLLARELQKKNMQFDMVMYPNVGHFIPEPRDAYFTYLHYYTTLQKYLLETCFV